VKNQRLLIEALAIVSRHIDVRLDLVGEDTLGGELQRQAEQQGVAGRVTFHGFLPQNRLAARYAAADLYVQSSLHEAAGVSVLEAAAAGVPVTGTRVGYVADWAKDRALAMDAADTGSMTRAIFALHTDGERARAMAARARAWVLEHDAGWAAGRFDELYRDVVAPRLSPQSTVRG
jgi:glycosyltransferase involved in cell wall biosynthesis